MENESSSERHERSEIIRGDMAREWLSEAKLIAESTQLTDALEIMDFLEARAVATEPIMDGFRADSAPDISEPIYVMPLVSADALFSERYRVALDDSRNAASYSPDSRLLMLNASQPVSPTWKGILVLHEGMHAKVHSEEQYDWHDKNVFAAKERDTFMVQFAVMAAIGGSSYHDALQRKLEDQKGDFTDMDDKVSVPSRGNYDPLLDDAFGPAQSVFEQAARQTALWIDTVFHVLDTRLGEVQGAKDKVFFLKSLYAK